MLLLQDDVAGKTDAVKSHNHKQLSTAAENHKDESDSDINCQQGIFIHCQHTASLSLWLLLFVVGGSQIIQTRSI